MSLEQKTRRRCDVCGEVISSASYYSCTQETQGQADTWLKRIDYSSVSRGIGAIHGSYPPAPLDVCTDCWERMRLSKP